MFRRDPLTLPETTYSAEDCLRVSVPLANTPGQAYAERRGIPLPIAEAANVRYMADFGGRAALVVGLYDHEDRLASLHGRYLEARRGQDKMLTIGPGGGVVSILGGWRVDPLIVVEGLFDALSLGVCGVACVATIGRWVDWLPQVAVGRNVWLSFDRSRSGDAEALSYSSHMTQSVVRRMLPPGRSKDWNTALVNHGRGAVSQAVKRT